MSSLRLCPLPGSAAHRLLLWCLALALPLVGLASSLGHMLGKQHVHATPEAMVAIADPMAGWQDLRRIVPGDRRAADLVVGDLAASHHHHDGMERHHHRSGDAGVITLEGNPDAAAGDEPLSSGAAMVLAFDAGHAQRALPDAGDRWRRHTASVYVSRSPPLMERPPRG